MTEEAKTFTQADIDALQAEHTKAIADWARKLLLKTTYRLVTFRNRFTKSAL